MDPDWPIPCAADGNRWLIREGRVEDNAVVSSACVRVDARPFCRRNERRGRTKASGETSESYLWIPICGSWRMSGPRGCGREWYTSRTKPHQGGSVFFYARSCFRLYSTAANPLDANALFSGGRVSLQRVPARLNLAVLVSTLDTLSLLPAADPWQFGHRRFSTSRFHVSCSFHVTPVFFSSLLFSSAAFVLPFLYTRVQLSNALALCKTEKFPSVSPIDLPFSRNIVFRLLPSSRLRIVTPNLLSSVHRLIEFNVLRFISDVWFLAQFLQFTLDSIAIVFFGWEWIRLRYDVPIRTGSWYIF